MNKILKTVIEGQAPVYTLITESGETATCTRFHEKKTDKWHVKLPKDNTTGRLFVSEALLADKTEFEFADKTEHRSGLSGGGWKAKLTPEEVTQLAEHEAAIEAIKKAAQARVVKKAKSVKPDLDTVEGIEAEIARLMAKMAGKK